MKKKIIALLLCALICVPLILSSCQNNEVLPITEEPRLNYYSKTPVYKPTAIKAPEALELTGNTTISALSDCFATTTEYDAETNIRSYYLYSLVTGEQIAKKEINNDPSIEVTTETLSTVEIDLLDNYAIIYTYYEKRAEKDCEIYNANGDVVFTKKDIDGGVEIDDEYKHHVMVEDCLYRVEDDGKWTLVKDFGNSSFDKNAYREYTFRYVNGYYIAVYDAYSSYSDINVEIFDSQFKLRDSFDIIKYANASTLYHILSNGNILIYGLNYVAEDAQSYDVFVRGAKYNYEYKLYNIETKEITAIADLPILINNVNSSLANENPVFGTTSMVSSVNNLATGVEVYNGVATGKIITAIIDNDGNFVTAIDDMENATIVEIVAEDKFVVVYKHGTYVVNGKGEKLYYVEKPIEYLLKSYIVYDTEIVDYSGNKIFTIPEEYQIHEIYVDAGAIIFRKTVNDLEKGTYQEYYLWNGGESASMVYTTYGKATYDNILTYDSCYEIGRAHV